MTRYALLLVLTLPLAAQDLTPKASPAATALDQAAKAQTEDQKHVNDMIQQTRSSFDQNQKALVGEITKTQQAIEAKLKADKHYKAEIDHLNAVRKQLDDLGAKAQNDFARTIGLVQQKLQGENAQVDSLMGVVRSENGWSSEVSYDRATQKWHDNTPKAAEKK